jgi:signal transduction histidine kinase
VRLAPKLFLGFSLVVALLLGVGALSLAAIARLVAVNRDITIRALPAAQLASSLRDTVQALARLEGRYLVLGDVRYLTLIEERSVRARSDLARLAEFITSERERQLLRAARETFDAYREAVIEEQNLLRVGQRQGALRLAETHTRGLAERVDANLETLMEATQASARAAQLEAAAVEARTWMGVLVALGSAFVVALVTAGIIAHRLTRSLRVLSEATSAVAAGSFREPIEAKGGDEIAELGRAFNAMAAELRQLDELKDGFFATFSHELRSPLTSMREAAHLLRDEVPGGLNPKQARLVEIMEESTDRLLRLVNQILDLSRLRAGMLPIERQPVDLSRVVARAVKELRPQAEGAGLRLEVEQTGERFEMLGDGDRLMQVVVNLVANAVRFTPRGGRVTVRLIDAGPELEVQVEDSGMGIPPEAVSRIFGWYQQAHRRPGGSGLGLPIVRGLVEAHGGRVTVESQEGKGSRFTVLLPRQGASS